MAERKVLIIDDDDALLPMLKTAFKRYQFEVHVTSEGAEGLEMARKHGHDLVLLSVELPVGNGFLVCKEFKQDPKLKDIPVIITSRKATDADFEKHRKLKVRANDYLHKPFTDEELFAKVGNVVGFALSPDEFSELEAKVHDFLEERTKLEAEISDKADRIAELEAELEAAQKGGKDSARLEQKLAEAEAALLERDARIAELENETSELAGQRKQLEAELARQAEEARGLEAQLQQKETDLAALKAAAKEHGQRVAELESNSESLTEKLQESTAALEAQKEAEAGLRTEIERLQAELKSQQDAAAQSNDRISALEAQLREVSDGKDTLEETLAGTQKLVAAVELALGASGESLEKAARDAKAEAERAQSLDGEITALKTELTDTKKSLEKEAKKRTKLREVLEKAITTLE